MSNGLAWRWAITTLLASASLLGLSDGLSIRSFDGTGRLSFDRVTTATTYRVEWAPTPAGPWTNFTGAAGAALDSIPQFATGCYTCSVPMCYRVVATVTNAAPPLEQGPYLVVDLSGGSTAGSYPVSYLNNVPPGGWTDEYKTTRLVLRRIQPEFSYWMGSPVDELGRASDESRHSVTLTADFYLGVFEVTQKQWELVMGSWPSYFTNNTSRTHRPVEQVSYYYCRESPGNSDDPSVNWPANSTVNANSFMGKLRTKTGLTGFDLPTEAQWEYACRANTVTALNSGCNLTNATSDAQLSEVGRYAGNCSGGVSRNSDTTTGTTTVGLSSPNAWGLYDMHGNVMELCLDWYDNTYPSSATDPKGASGGTRRIARGGSWYHVAGDCRSATRGSSGPSDRVYHIGLRARCIPP